MSEPNNYDAIAEHYDILSRLAFGKAQVRAQQFLLPYVKEKSSILLVGGGTGWILEELASIFPSGLLITYVEISSRMIEIARLRDWKQNRVIFVNLPIEGYRNREKFDAILTPFLFDNFAAPRAAQVFDTLDRMLETDGIWLFTDFYEKKGKSRWWQNLLLKSMYRFFRAVCHIEATTLLDMHSYFESSNYQVAARSYHFQRFIKSVVYLKQETDH